MINFVILDLIKNVINEYFIFLYISPNSYKLQECGVTRRTYTYWQLNQQSKRLAISLLKAGIKPGQVLAVVLPNCPEFVITIFAGLEAGLKVCPVNPSYTPGI